jgi:hypothetical protein
MGTSRGAGTHGLLGACQAILTRATGNCELRSVVMCSHGIKDGRTLRSMDAWRTNHQSGSIVGAGSPGGTLRVGDKAGKLADKAGAHADTDGHAEPEAQPQAGGKDAAIIGS